MLQIWSRMTLPFSGPWKQTRFGWSWALAWPLLFFCGHCWTLAACQWLDSVKGSSVTACKGNHCHLTVKPSSKDWCWSFSRWPIFESLNIKLLWVLRGHRATMLVNVPNMKPKIGDVTISYLWYRKIISVYNNDVLQRETTIIASMMNWSNW